MSKEPPKIRTTLEIKPEYDNICGLAGHEQFLIKASESKLFQFNQQLAKLHNEYNHAEAREKLAALTPPEEPNENQS